MLRTLAEKAGGALALLTVVGAAQPGLAITAGQTDDFEDGTTQGWGPDFAFSIVNAPDEGPAGAGDDALLLASTGVARQGSRSIAINTDQWAGDWTAAGVTAIEFDARNANDFEVVLWLGIAGPGMAGSAGTGDTYVSLGSATIGPNSAWDRYRIDATVADFETATNHSFGTLADALAGVTQFRIFHNVNDRNDPFVPNNFVGDVVDADIYLDNITAVPEPALLTLLPAVALLRRRRARSDR